jgi:hypothetical protein
MFGSPKLSGATRLACRSLRCRRACSPVRVGVDRGRAVRAGALPRFESRPPRKESEDLARVGLFRGRNDERETDTERDETDAHDDGCSMELRDVVETALAEALMLAARTGRWGIVEQIASELRARRERAPRSDRKERRRQSGS